ncbi:unnamed protein product [Aphis gossypii]|uniref:Uncharacterized protein n=1 Tax=Aphis gossypii TaxID=80765 RepID=A0A9P0IYF5_APHGO|nr:unnamed protein product [Aphis gossypii]
MTNNYNEFDIQEIIKESPIFPSSMIESTTIPYSPITPSEAFSPDMFPSSMIESITALYSAITPPEAFSPDMFPSSMIESINVPYSAITPPEAFSPDMFPSSMIESINVPYSAITPPEAFSLDMSPSPSMLHMLPLKTPREFHNLIIGVIKQCRSSLLPGVTMRTKITR